MLVIIMIIVERRRRRRLFVDRIREDTKKLSAFTDAGKPEDVTLSHPASNRSPVIGNVCIHIVTVTAI